MIRAIISNHSHEKLRVGLTCREIEGHLESQASLRTNSISVAQSACIVQREGMHLALVATSKLSLLE